MQARDELSGVDPLHTSDETPFDESSQNDPANDAGKPAATRSLVDNMEALLEDARIYIDAELSYQKTRAGFVADRLKKTVAFGAVAAFLAVLALIGLTVGLIIALTPLITAWGATAVVVLGILLFAYILVRKAAAAWKSLMGAMKENEDTADHG